MNKLLLVMIAVLSCSAAVAQHDGALSSDVLKKLDSYNVNWNTMSTTGSLESMPLGNGDITVNAWVEQGGDLMLYVGKSDAWAESTRLLKVGRVRVSLSPNPFEKTDTYVQTLRLADGRMNVAARSKSVKCDISVWVDANSPVVHVDVSADRRVSVTCTSELMRKDAFVLPHGGHPLADSFRGVAGSPVKPSESADIVLSDGEAVIWAHRNETSLYPLIMERQNAEEFVSRYPDPYMHRTFGAMMTGTGMKVSEDGLSLVSESPAKTASVDIVAYTAQTQTLEQWKSEVLGLAENAGNADRKSAGKAHVQWWRDFWNRSWIFMTGDEDARKATEGYILQRYMMACQGRGAYPVKFNGGTLTFDYKGNDADFRRWGPGYWHQNCRLYYWPLVVSGDFDLLKPWFDMYMDMMPLQMDVTRKYYGHGGAFFPETLNFFGMFIQDDWGWDNKDGKASQTRWIRYHYSGALEMLALMLEYYDYTDDETFAKEYVIPFAEQTIRFFKEHWPVIDRKFSFIPANSLEQFWDCLNPVDYIAGLKYTLAGLAGLPEGLVSDALKDEWEMCAKAVPEIPMADGRILPAYEYGEGRNLENPELYAVFPFRLYGLGLPDIEVARKTFGHRVFDAPTCWAQDAVQAALMGNAEDARKYLMRKVNAVDKEIRFPAFWRPGSDYTPDLDNGGVIALTMQYMLLNCVNGQEMILPALPEGWSADFKLRTPDGKSVRVVSEGSEVVRIERM